MAGKYLMRRRVVQIGTTGVTGTLLARNAAAAVPEIDAGKVQDGRVQFPAWTAPTERPSGGPPNPMPVNERVGFAVVGLGRLALEEVLPAFGETKKSRLVALVSGTPDKAARVAAEYGVRPEAVYDYAGFDRIRDNPEIKVVYIILPNSLHKEYTIRAAQAGKDVLCEKPMAVSSSEGQAMVDACRAAQRKLMIAYRCQYEPYNREVLRMVREQVLGPARFIDAVNTQNQGDPTQWRLKRALAGGGSLPDIGLYCLNAARFLTGEEPIEVFARTFSPPGDPRFGEVEETVNFMLRFPSGVVANCASSYGMHESRFLRVHTPGGAISLDGAFAYGDKQLRIAHREGRAESVDERRLPMQNQFALEMDHMADCVIANRQPHTPGEEGVQDHRIMEAIYRSADSGQPVAMPRIEGLDRTRGPAPSAS
jgi:predicted dehydrogenase